MGVSIDLPDISKLLDTKLQNHYLMQNSYLDTKLLSNFASRNDQTVVFRAKNNMDAVGNTSFVWIPGIDWSFFDVWMDGVW